MVALRLSENSPGSDVSKRLNVAGSVSRLPAGWQGRLIRIETPATMGAVGWCLEPHDLAVSKLAAGREKDYSFVEAMVRRRMVSVELVIGRLTNTPGIDPLTR